MGEGGAKRGMTPSQMRREARRAEVRQASAPRSALLDRRQVQPLAEVTEPAVGPSPPSTAATSATEDNLGELLPSRTGNVLLDDVLNEAEDEDCDDEDYEENDPRDVRAVEHLHEHRPRAMDPGAGYLREPQQKRFAESLSDEEWEAVHNRVLLLGTNIAKAARLRHERKREVMDTNRVFHPEANKLRAEAQLAVELRRELRYSALEGAVLEEMLQRERLRTASSNERNKAELTETFRKPKRKEVVLNGAGSKIKPPGNAGKASVSPGSAAQGRRHARPQIANRAAKANEEPGVEEQGDDTDECEEESVVDDDADPSLMTFEDYRKRRVARGGGKGKRPRKGAVKSQFTPIEEFVKARALGFRGDRVKLRNPRPGVPVGKPNDRSVPRCNGRSRDNDGGGDKCPPLSSEDAEGETLRPETTASTDSDPGTQKQRAATPEIATDGASQGGPRSLGQKRKQSSATVAGQDFEPQLLGDLQRLFEMLELPPENQLELMVKYSDPKHSMKLIDAANDWLEAGELVKLLERTIAVLWLARDKRVDSTNAFSEEETEKLESLGCFISMAQMFGATCAHWVEAITNKLMDVVQAKVHEVETKWGDTFLYRGHGYFNVRFKNRDEIPVPLKHVGNGTIVRLNGVLMFQ